MTANSTLLILAQLTNLKRDAVAEHRSDLDTRLDVPQLTMQPTNTMEEKLAEILSLSKTLYCSPMD